MVPEPAPLPTRRPLPLGSAASDAAHSAVAANAANAASCAARAIARRPRAPRNMQTPPPPYRPSRSCPPRALTVKVSQNWAEEPLRPPRERQFWEKTALGAFAPHLVEKLKKNGV